MKSIEAPQAPPSSSVALCSAVSKALTTVTDTFPRLMRIRV